MSLYRHTRPLLVVSTPTDTGQVGATHVVLPSDGDRVADQAQSYRVFFDATQEGGATGPATDVRLETSHDKQNWVNVASATQLTQDGQVHEFKDVTALGPFVRAVTQLGGATKPNHTAVVVLASNAPFRVKALS